MAAFTGSLALRRHLSNLLLASISRNGAPFAASRCNLVRVRLTKKLAECIDDVDLSRYRVGDILELPERDARLLIAEGCAEQLAEVRQQTQRRKQQS